MPRRTSTARPEFTDPEILRTNLASVILQMTALGLGDIARFPFVEPPDTRSVQAGMQLLEEIGAITTEPAATSPRTPAAAAAADAPDGRAARLTKVGRQLARLPIDPRLGRMMVEAAASTTACARSSPSWLRCRSKTRASARATSRSWPTRSTGGSPTRRPTSPALLNLWRYVKEQQKALSSSAFRRMCRSGVPQLPADPRVAGPRRQLRQVAKQLELAAQQARRPRPRRIHRALLAGLLSHIGMRTPTSATTSARAAPGSRSSPARRCSRSSRSS